MYRKTPNVEHPWQVSVNRDRHDLGEHRFCTPIVIAIGSTGHTAPLGRPLAVAASASHSASVVAP